MLEYPGLELDTVDDHRWLGESRRAALVALQFRQMADSILVRGRLAVIYDFDRQEVKTFRATKAGLQPAEFDLQSVKELNAALGEVGSGAGSRFSVEGEVQVTDVAEVPSHLTQLGAFRRTVRRYQGALNAKGESHFISGFLPPHSGAPFVELELVTGNLNGRNGSFALHRSGIWDDPSRAEQEIGSVVSGTGTEQLTGLAGHLVLRRQDGRLFYRFEYALPTR